MGLGLLVIMNLDFVSFLKTLKPKDWNIMVTDSWTVKDVVAHMVGWEKGDPEAIRKAWKTKKPPWWMEMDDYDDFNKKNVDFYKDFSPEELIGELEKWQRHNQKEIDRIGEEKLRARPDLFGWLFEEGEGSHYSHHYDQIKKALNKE